MIIFNYKLCFWEFNMLQSLLNVINFMGNQAKNSVDPIYDAIDTIGPWAMMIVTLLGAVYGLIIGVKFAKAEDSKERAALQKALINGIIGFVAMLVLIGILYAIRGPLVEWMNS